MVLKELLEGGYKMSYMETILREKKKNWDPKASNSEIIGLEIRRKRLELSITLQNLCFDLCSPSYLCKIERNQIQPNRQILNELCKRMDITDKQRKMLFNSYQVLIDSVAAYAKGNVDKLKEFYNQGAGFENYRYRIIQYIYYIFIDDRFKAKEIYRELVRIMENMQTIDMMIFSLFSGILFYSEGKYKICISVLNAVDVNHLDDYANIIRLRYLYLASHRLLSYDTLSYYYEYKGLLYKQGFFSDLEKLHYSLGIFALKVESDKLFDEAKSLIHEDIYKDTLSFLKAYQDKDMDMVIHLKEKSLLEFAKYLALTLYKEGNATEVIFHLSNRNDSYDFSTDLLKYLCLDDIEKKKRFITDYLKNTKLNENRFIVSYFLKELTRINMEKPHYKETVYLYYDYIKGFEKR